MPHFTMEYSANLDDAVDFPALCKAYPDKCGMRTYKDRTFDLREYKADSFDEIAPSHSSGFPP